MDSFKPYYSLNAYYQSVFHKKIARLSLDAGFTCPNRDGTLGVGGCIFCSARGSGDFAGAREHSITEQLTAQKKLLFRKWNAAGFLAYFQAFTNTYAPIETLRRAYEEALSFPGLCGLVIATRPDCLSEEVLCLLVSLRAKYRLPISIELGFQTANEQTAVLIRRGYQNDIFASSVRKLAELDFSPVAHIILGLPGETEEDVLHTVSYLNALPISGIKITALYVLKDTALAEFYQAGQYHPLEQPEYLYLLGQTLSHLRPDIVIHRITGDGSRDSLLAPLWSLQKKRVLNAIHQYLEENNIFQGKFYSLTEKKFV